RTDQDYRVFPRGRDVGSAVVARDLPLQDSLVTFVGNSIPWQAPIEIEESVLIDRDSPGETAVSPQYNVSGSDQGMGQIQIQRASRENNSHVPDPSLLGVIVVGFRPPQPA